MLVHQSRCSPTQEILGVHDKKEQVKTIEELSEASKVPLEGMFNRHDNCGTEWKFKTRASEEGNMYNETDDKFSCKQKDNQLYNLLKKTILPFQMDKFLKESLHMFDPKKRINE